MPHQNGNEKCNTKQQEPLFLDNRNEVFLFFFFLAHIVDFGLRKLWVYLTVFTSWDHFQAQCARLAHQKP